MSVAAATKSLVLNEDEPILLKGREFNSPLNTPRASKEELVTSPELSTQIVTKTNPSRLLFESVSKNDTFKVINLLEANNSDVNWICEEQKRKSSLIKATENGNLVLVAMLLGKGADVSHKDEEGNSALTIALEMGNKELQNLLATKTNAALDELKRKYELAIAQNMGDTTKMLSERAKFFYRLPEEKSQDLTQLPEQLHKIFNAPKPTSVFQSHFPRESPLTAMLTISHFQTIYNIFVAVLLLSFTNTVLHNIYESGSPIDLSLLFWCFSKLPEALGIWLCMMVWSFTAYGIQSGLVTRALPPWIAYTLYAITVIVKHLAVSIYVRVNEYPPATSLFLMCEAVRITMKMHSYLMVNRLLRKFKGAPEFTDDISVKEYPQNITFGNFFEFLWLPTLVYQTSYPRNPSRSALFIVRSFMDAFLCILYIYAIFVRYCVPVFHEITGDFPSLLLATFKLAIPGIGVSLLAFFMVLHSWLNGWAELTQFADRRFYSDWWNSRSWAEYYRKWNIVVHNFIHRHVFMECILGLNMSKNASMWIAFIGSAVIHEYVIAISIGFYRPILFSMFVVPGVLFIYLTRIMRDSRLWNVFMWGMLMIGHGFLVSLYCRAWHFHYYTEHTFSWMDLFRIF